MLNGEARKLAEYLRHNCYGQEHAMTKAEVSRRLGIPERKLFDLAQECRDAGWPIVSTCTGAHYGMFYAISIEEIGRAEAELKSRLNAIRKHLDSLTRIELQVFEDMPLFARY